MPARNADLDSLYRPDSSADLIAAGALSGSPESNGGAGLYSMPSWIVWAVVSPAISAATVSPKSISEVTPPAVITLPSRTTLPCSCVPPDKGQQIGKGPMGRRPPSFEYSGNPQNECAGANRRDVLCSTRLPADELYGFAIADCPDDAVASARDAEQIEWRTVRKGVRWHEAQPAIAGHRRV